MIKRVAAIVVVVAALLAMITVAILPPLPLAAPSPDWNRRWPVVRGAYHVHSQRSDGTGTLDEIAAAAARSGLAFVVLTDHGNGTRPPEPPAYRDGVLMIDGVEISTDYGHYVALGLPQTPYPLGGHVRDVIADVRRFGGFGIAAHPGSPKAGLQWSDWDAPFDGLEWLNADSEWRDEFWGSLGGVLLTYASRPTETLAHLLDRPQPVIDHWQRLTRTRRIPALAGADAHARLGLRQASDPYEDRVLARLPSYDVSFAAFSNYVVLHHSFSGDAATDAGLVLTAIREGRVFTVINGLAAVGDFEMRGLSGETVVTTGEYLEVAGDAIIEAQMTAPEGTTLHLLRDGAAVYDSPGGTLRVHVNEPGAYHIEARLPASAKAPSVPWLFSNPIYVGLRDAHARAVQPPAAFVPASERSGIATAAWRAEASEGSTSTLTQSALPDGTPALEWRFTLAAGPRGEQYAALRFPVAEGFARQRGLQLRIQADAPRRLWAQLRAPGGRGERWGTSLYADRSLQSIDIAFAELRPLGPTSSAQPGLDRVDSLLLVIDTVNTMPGTAGTLWIPDLWLVR